MAEQERFGIDAPRLTGAVAGLVGIGYLVVAVSHFLMPAEQLHFASGVDGAFFRSLAAESAMFELHYWAMALTALGATGVVLGLGSELPTWFQWIRVLAVAGFVVTAVSFVAMQSQALQIARTFAGLEPTAREAVVNRGVGNLDPSGLFGFGLIGSWLVALNVLAFERSAWHPALAVLGVVGGAVTMGAFVGTVLRVPLLVDVAAGLGAGVIIPAWFLVIGWRLGRGRSAASTSRGTTAMSRDG